MERSPAGLRSGDDGLYDCSIAARDAQFVLDRAVLREEF